MKVTDERLQCDFRDTLKEIVNVKNGRQIADGFYDKDQIIKS
jgi:hypothetical protein